MAAFLLAPVWKNKNQLEDNRAESKHPVSTVLTSGLLF